jgi:hypothetical protein
MIILNSIHNPMINLMIWDTYSKIDLNKTFNGRKKEKIDITFNFKIFCKRGNRDVLLKGKAEAEGLRRAQTSRL